MSALAPIRSLAAFGCCRGLHNLRVRGCLHTILMPSSSTVHNHNVSKRHCLSTGGDDLNNNFNLHLPPSFSERRKDVNEAIKSVFAAARITRNLQPSSSKRINTLSKKDSSPVTVGDFSAQAVVLHLLHKNYPHDMYISEESSVALQNDVELMNNVYEAVNYESDHKLDREQIIRSIDYGQGIDTESSYSKATVARRIWCLDPIDGTKGFLRGRVEGGQYCIALALIEDGQPVVSVLGCPNLPLSSTEATKTWSEKEVQESEKQNMFSTTRGCLFVAVRGCGCYEIPLHAIERLYKDTSPLTSYWTKLSVTPNDGVSSRAVFCLGVERGFSDPNGTVLKMAELINGQDSLTSLDKDGIQDIKNSMRIDGQGKYGILARGDAECFVRLPKDGYIDWVWDVAAGYLVLKEAGGQMTDVLGQPIDFSHIGGEQRTAKLPQHVKGIFGSCGGVFHESLVNAYAKVLQQ